MIGALDEFAQSLAQTAATLGEIGALTQEVVGLRSGVLMAGWLNPFAVHPFEHGLMVAEKLAVMGESAVAVGAAVGVALLSGDHPLRAADAVSRAATTPVVRRLRSNAERLGGAPRP
ncbi:hypothetical protein [Prosthecomicrobium sp. N25]|uniref:hypothetical protein n=1 Tax=Prosthecomicrobium sp. N25 TaxID=3129254 RepID=UPI003078730A